jgi:7-cyano-7-deazaguanine synthase
MNKKYAVLSLSGGMDSSTLLLHLLNEGYDCTCLSFDYGQKHRVELERATELVSYINSFPIENNFKGLRNYCPVKHQIIKLDGLAQLLNSSLVEGGSEVPEGHYAEENMKDTVVPNRNKIFSSIIQAVALSIADKNNHRMCYCYGYSQQVIMLFILIVDKNLEMLI